jgi:hypothetical protein
MAISLGENPDPELAGVQLSIISMWASGSSFDVSQQGDLANGPRLHEGDSRPIL